MTDAPFAGVSGDLGPSPRPNSDKLIWRIALVWADHPHSSMGMGTCEGPGAL
jgi:hypothetical protein